jgi:hypothetical protein
MTLGEPQLGQSCRCLRAEATSYRVEGQFLCSLMRDRGRADAVVRRRRTWSPRHGDELRREGGLEFAEKQPGLIGNVDDIGAKVLNLPGHDDRRAE